MKKYIPLFLLLCFSVTAFAAGKDADTVKIYKDTWLNIEYCDVKDVLKYEGTDKRFTELKKRFSTNNLKYGVVFISFPNKDSDKANLHLELCAILKIGNKKIKSISNFNKWLRFAKAGKKYHGLFTYFGDSKNTFVWTLPDKPKGYKMAAAK